MTSTPTVFEAQLDWLTITEPRDGNADLLLLLGEVLQRAEEAAHCSAVRRNFMGFACVMAGRARWGLSDSHAILQLSGQMADAALPVALAVSTHVTRLDLAVTVRLDPADYCVADDARDQFLAWKEGRTRWPAQRLVTDCEGGATLYLGKRGNERLSRLYNKEAERASAKDKRGRERYRSSWRYELETGGALAPRLALDCATATDRGVLIQGVVHDYYTAHGITPAFPSVGSVVLSPGFTRRADATRSLDWIGGQVAPVLKRLMVQNYHKPLAHALGLSGQDLRRLADWVEREDDAPPS